MIPAQIVPKVLSCWAAALPVAASRLSAALLPAAVQQTARFSSAKEEESQYVYLPPGSSMKEPVYISTSDPVYYVDDSPKKIGQPAYDPTRTRPVKTFSSKPKQATVTHLPSSMAEAESLKLAFTTKKQKDAEEKKEDATYVYLPPGSSMKEPVYISLSDPVYFVDNKGH